MNLIFHASFLPSLLSSVKYNILYHSISGGADFDEFMAGLDNIPELELTCPQEDEGSRGEVQEKGAVNCPVGSCATTFISSRNLRRHWQGVREGANSIPMSSQGLCVPEPTTRSGQRPCAEGPHGGL